MIAVLYIGGDICMTAYQTFINNTRNLFANQYELDYQRDKFDEMIDKLISDIFINKKNKIEEELLNEQ